MTGEPKKRSEHEREPDPPGRRLRTAPELANGYEVRANAFINWSGSSLVISILPKVSKAVWRHLGVANRVLDVLVPEISLQRPGIVALASQQIAAGMPKHVRMDRKR